MAILGMIPRQYWAQLKAELNALDPRELGDTAPDEETPAQRSARIAAEYDAAITRRMAEDKKGRAAARRLTPQYQEAQRRAAEKRKAERAQNPPKPGGRPRLPTDGLTPEEIARREYQRQQGAKRRAAEKAERERLKNALRKGGE